MMQSIEIIEDLVFQRDQQIDDLNVQIDEMKCRELAMISIE
jgi:hypothetical protein